MLTKRTLFGAACLLLPAAVEAAPAGEREKTYSAAAVAHDLEVIWAALHDVSPEPFMTARPAVVRAAYERARAGLIAPMSVRSAWLAIAPVLGALNDGHVGLGFPDDLNAAPGRFPLRFSAPERGAPLSVRHDRTGTIPPGSRIVSIDGVGAADFLTTTMAAFGGQTNALVRWRVGAAGAWTAIAMFGDKSTYRVRWMAPSGEARQAEIPAAPSASSSPRGAGEPYSFSWARRGVGLIDYRRCEDLDRFRGFLDATFTRLKTAAATALVIDIRRNAGGDSALNDLLWTYAQARPFKQFGGTIEKSSARLKKSYGRERYVGLYGEAAWSGHDGEILRSILGPEEGLTVPGPLPIRFAGPVYLLVSADTFSSGMSCALAAKDYGLATLVGQETGEPANGTGELYTLVTPNLGLKAFLTTKVFLAPRRHPNGRGVTPDVPVTESGAEASRDRDPVLERALALIGSA